MSEVTLYLSDCPKPIIIISTKCSPKNPDGMLLSRSTCRPSSALDLISASIHIQYSAPTKIATHLDHIIHCKTTSGTNESNRWTYRVFILDTRPD